MVLKLAQCSFLLLIFSLPFVRPFSVSIAGLVVPTTDFIFLVTAGLTAVALIRREMDLRYDRAFLAVLIYAGSLSVTVVFPDASFVKLLGEFYLFGLCFLTFLHCGDPEFCRKILIVWLAATTVTCFLSLLGVVLFYAGMATESDNYFLSRVGSLPAGNYPRVQSLFANPNMLCNYLNVSIPLIWYALKKEWFSRSVVIAAFTISIIAAVFTMSPGLGGIALSLGLIGYLFCSGHKRRTVAVCAGALIAAGFLAMTLISPDTENTEQQIHLPFVEKALEPSVRVLVWENALARASEFPIFGRGIGSGPAQLKYQTLSGEKQLLTDAHNIYLDVLGQAGIVGLATFLFLIIQIFRRTYFGYRDPKDLVIVLGSAFAGSVIYQGLSGSFEDARHIWILIGMLIAVSSIKGGENDISQASKELLLHPSN